MPLSKRILPHGKRQIIKIVSGSGVDGNYYVTGASWNSGTSTLTLNQTGTSNISVVLSGTTGGGGGGGTPGGSNTYIQYNNAGAFGGVSAMYYNSTNESLNLHTSVAGDGSLRLRNTSGTSTANGLSVFDESDNRRLDVGYNNNADETYFWSYGDVPIKIATSGTERMRVAADGKVGVGTTGPNYKLDVYDAGTSFVTRFKNASTNGYVMRLEASDSTLDFQTDHIISSYHMHLGNDNRNWYMRTSGQKFGVGTSSPQTEMTLRGALSFLSGSTTSAPGYKSLWASGSGLYWGDEEVYTNAPGTSEITGGGASERIAYFDGTSSITGTSNFEWDDATLKMTNTGDTAITLLGDANRSGENSHVMAMRGKWDGTTIGTVMIASGPDTTNKDDGQLMFYTANAGTQAERMRIDETGNIGIGTTAPEKTLHVKSAGTSGVKIQTSDASSYAQLQFTSPNTGYSLINFGDGDASSPGYIQYTHSSDLMLLKATKTIELKGASAAGYINFSTDNTERMRIKGDGTVGVGLTNPASFSDAFSVQIGSDSGWPIGFVNAAEDVKGAIRTDQGDNYIAFASKSESDIRFFYNDSEANTSLMIKGSGATAGNVGIGTTAPNTTLEVLSTTEQARFSYDASNYLGFSVSSVGDSQLEAKTGHLTFKTDTAAHNIRVDSKGDFRVDLGNDSGYAMRVRSSSGNPIMYAKGSQLVGIGTETPKAKLDISGALTFTSGSVTSAPGYTSLWASGSGLYWGDKEVYTNAPGTSEITGGGAADQVAYFSAASNITGSSNLIFDGTNLNPKDHLLMENDKYIKFYQNGGSTYHTSIGYNTSNELQLGGLYGVHLRTYSGGWGNRVTVASDGDVGIGTVAPASKLHVAASGTIANGIVVGNAGNSGLYEYNAAQMRVAVGGVDKLRITPEGCQFGSDGSWSPSVRVGTGSANAPSATNIAFRPLQDDTDTGYSRSADDTLALVASGTQMMTINPTGVGIGTTAPRDYLEVASSADDDPAIRLTNSRSGVSGSLMIQHRGSSINIKADESNPMRFSMGSTEKMRITSSGTGIGTVAPTNGNALTIAGTMDVSNNIDVGNRVRKSATYFLDFSNTSTGLTLAGYQSYRPQVSGNAAGNGQDLGMSDYPWDKIYSQGLTLDNQTGGDTSPGTKTIWVSGSDVYWGTSKLNAQSGGGSSVSFGSDNQIPYTNAGGDDFDYSANLTFDGTDLFLDTSGGGKLKLGAATEYIQGSGSDVRIYASDNVLISPTDDLNIRADDVTIETTSAAEYARFDGGNQRLGIGTTAPSGKLHIVAGDEALVIERNNTDSAIYGPSLYIQRKRASAPVDLQADDLIGNLTFRPFETDFDNRAATISAAVEGTITTDTTPGRLMFSTAGAGANTTTERMRIDSAGNVGIGTDSPSMTLNVAGTDHEVVDIESSHSAGASLKIDATAAGGTHWKFQSTADGSGHGAGKLSIQEAGTNRVAIVGGGAVGIGTTSPDAKLEVLSTTEQLRLTHTDASKYMSTAVDTNGSTTWTNQKSFRFTGEQTDGVFQIDQNQITLVRDTDSAASAMLKLGDHTTYDQFSILEDQRGSTATNGLLYLRSKKTGNAGYATLALGAISGSNTSYLYVNGISTNEAFRFDTNSKSHALDIAKAGYVSIGGAVSTTDALYVNGSTRVNGSLLTEDYIQCDKDGSPGILIGEGGDADIYYDGTNMRFNAARVGTGKEIHTTNVHASGASFQKSMGESVYIRNVHASFDQNAILQHAPNIQYVKPEAMSAPGSSAIPTELPLAEADYVGLEITVMQQWDGDPTAALQVQKQTGSSDVIYEGGSNTASTTVSISAYRGANKTFMVAAAGVWVVKD